MTAQTSPLTDRQRLRIEAVLDFQVDNSTPGLAQTFRIAAKFAELHNVRAAALVAHVRQTVFDLHARGIITEFECVYLLRF